MSDYAQPLSAPHGFAIHAAVNARMSFIRRTYLHLAAEIVLVGFVAALVVRTPFLLSHVAMPIVGNMIFYILALFGVSFVSRKLMERQPSVALQYAGAGLWVVFLGLIVGAFAYYVGLATGSYAILGQAFVLTGCVFTGLTAYVFFTKKDFSPMGGALSVITMIVFGVSIILAFMGGAGGIVYSIVWAVLLAGWVLYDTSKVMYRRRVTEHVAASVDLLVDFVFMFLHIVQILMASRR
jgi:FtsH-binding integral membrane protein